MDNQPVTLTGLTPREAILDAYYRMAWALDYNDWKLFESAWVTQGTPLFQMEDGLRCVGLENIKSGLFDVVCGLDTQHIGTNARIHIDPEAKASRMWIMALNQHFRKGQEAKAGSPRLWGGNKYMFDLVEEDGIWKIKEWYVRLGWNEGDLSIVGR